MGGMYSMVFQTNRPTVATEVNWQTGVWSEWFDGERKVSQICNDACCESTGQAKNKTCVPPAHDPSIKDLQQAEHWQFMTINAPAEGVKLTGVNFSYVEGKAPVEGEVLNTCICEVKNAATDAHLNMLSLSAGTLHPAFDMAVFNYTLEVTPGQTSTNVIAETNE